MLHVNEDNNDDLFRKAAEDYFLSAANPDSETFINKMNADSGVPVNEIVPTDKKKKYGFGFLISKWLHNKTRHTKLSFFFRIVSFTLRPGKNKKKINPVFYRGILAYAVM